MEKCRFPLTPSSLSRDNDASGEDDNLVPGCSLFLTLAPAKSSLCHHSCPVPDDWSPNPATAIPNPSSFW